MGLRINTNIAAVNALRNLRQADKSQQISLQRLSTGLRISTASDDPSGLVISEQLRAQIASLNQAVINTDTSSNLIGTTEAALAEVDGLLIQIREALIFALNTGGASDEQIDTEQDAVDSAIQAIDRISGTTRYARTNLLNGAQAFRTSSVDTSINNLTLRSVFFGTGVDSLTFDVSVTEVASHAVLAIGSFGATSGVIRVGGKLGSEELFVLPGDSVSGAINSVRDFTGVFASGGFLFSEGYGTREFVTVDVLRGAYTGASGSDFGANAKVGIDGANVSAVGFDLKTNGAFLKSELTLASTVTAGSTFSFTVKRSGLNFQLNSENVAQDSLRVGIPSIDPSSLGFEVQARGASGGTFGGFLTSLVAGGANDLRANPANALNIIDRALDQINGLRGYLGAVEQQNLQPNSRALAVAIENLTASEAAIRDLDFAAEVSEFTRSQVLFAAGTSVLASANLIPQTVLSLLQ